MMQPYDSTSSQESLSPGVTAFSQLGLEYAYLRIERATEMEQYFNHPSIHDSLSLILCLKGQMELELNTRSLTVGADSLFFYARENVITVKSISEEFEASVLITSHEFLSMLNLDLNVMSTIALDPLVSPVISMSNTEMHLLKAYVDLIHYNTLNNSEPIYVRSISRNLFAAAIYQVLQFESRNSGSDAQRDGDGQRAARGHNYVRDFHHLVLLHHTRERKVAFYAEKLFLSPKYLSHLIKEMTGRSAAEWIDYHVIQEAKNLLRYSGKNVQQVAYELNFPNQSAFGKYFKHITGMSPTQFQRS